MSTGAWVGRSRAALESGAIVRGELTYVTDHATGDLAHGVVLRSPIAHGLLRRVDATAARALPGVLAVVLGADVPVNALGPRPEDGPVLATDRVRQVGEPIALVVAESEQLALTALALIEVELEPLPVIDGPEAALAGQVMVHPSRTDNRAAELSFASGDVESMFGSAALVVEHEVTTASQEHVALETPGGVAQWHPAQPGEPVVTIRCGSQNPGLHQRKVARALELDPAQVRMIAGPVGGAFGSRNDDPVPVHLALMARAVSGTGRPVRLHLTREEVMTAGTKRHPFTTTIRMGLTAEGRVLAVDVRAVSDTGPVLTSGPNVLKTSAEMSTGPYAMDAARFDGVVVFSNNSNNGAFRGYGVPQVAFAVETALTDAAARLGIDPAELRARNALTGGGRHGLYRHRVTDSLLVGATIEAARAHPWWTGRESWARDDSSARWPWRRGTGLASAMKGVGMGSGTGDVARARLRIGRDGRVTIWAGPNHTGQSIQTTYGQIAADRLGFGIDTIDVIVGDTAMVPESGPTAASRSTYAGGGAVERACEELVTRCRDLGLPLDTDPVAVGEKLVQLGSAEVLAEFLLPETDDAGLVPAADLGRYGPHRVYGSCTQVVRVEVNPLTGEVRVPQILCVVDCGTAVNPVATIGQAEGGVLQGLGLALMEEHLLVQGIPVTTDLERYVVPTIVDTPVIETVLIPGAEPTGPFGAKGMSEVVVVPTGPALTAAIHDAVGVLPHRLPVTPERLLALIEEAPCG